MNNRQLSESESLERIVRLFIAQYLASVRTNQINQTIIKQFKMKPLICLPHISSEVFLQLLTDLVIKNLVIEIKHVLIMQGRTEPNCLHQLFVIKQMGMTDIEKFCTFLLDKRQFMKQTKVNLLISFKGLNPTSSPIYFLKVNNFQFLEAISKIFQNDYQLANKYQKDKHYATIRVIRNPYLFNLNDESECLPFKCGIDEAFNKPPEFTYKTTVEKIERQKKNVQNLIAFTRRENRKALGLYLDSLKEQHRPKKKVKQNQQEIQLPYKTGDSQYQKSKQFDFIGFL